MKDFTSRLKVLGLRIWHWLNAMTKKKRSTKSMTLPPKLKEFTTPSQLTDSWYALKCGDMYLTDRGFWTSWVDEAMYLTGPEARLLAKDMETQYQEISLEEV